MHKDATGRPITKGSYVAYVVTTGSRAGIKFGVVVKLKEKETQRNVYDHATKQYDEVTETDYSIQIVSAERAGNWNEPKKWAVQGKVEGKLARVHSVERLDRVVMLDPHQMLPEAKEALDAEMRERGL